ncbi:dephospho-CoA kinase [Ottowia sp.]|uniref:dephospho-CoA kinase n=1 Tax=Ottowia sp. TaxID=1898956 RepID=UPI002C8427C4|nr:dephospho-CoA kinase [Ottowia sp.]HOB66403.1 dephospho-CoA kinase [Ottowia sp.]HPZ58291.1 dephospho-CoA kinase [Ottowia sp.]HQD48710.1 dephospho-CoA kinase [Ottowia sp.]
MAALLGLTGGIGSGKSTVARVLAGLGAAVIDADAISRAMTAANGPALPAIAEAFGPTMIGTDGALDRAAMRAQVFHDDGARRRLEAIIHPLVAAETDRQTRGALDTGHALLVYDVPLLVESGTRWRAKVDRVLVVDCEPATQIERVMARNGLPRAQVEQIVAAQATRAQRLAAADLVLFNGAGVTLEALQAQARQAAAAFKL